MKRYDFDGVLKEAIQKDRPRLLVSLANGHKVKEFLNVELPRVRERQVDLALLLDDDSIMHIELQSTNDRRAAFRMGHYYLLLKERYERAVMQVVLYVGSRRMAMASGLRADGNVFACRLLDIREFDAGALLESGSPGDVALAVLAAGGDRKLPEILKRASQIKGAARERLMAQLLVLAGLRGLEEKIEWELRRLGVVIDITKNKVLMRWQREAVAEGKAEGMTTVLHEVLEAKFGRVPKWADGRLKKATPPQLQKWARKVLTADTLEAVVGPR